MRRLILAAPALRGRTTAIRPAKWSARRKCSSNSMSRREGSKPCRKRRAVRACTPRYTIRKLRGETGNEKQEMKLRGGQRGRAGARTRAGTSSIPAMHHKRNRKRLPDPNLDLRCIHFALFLHRRGTKLASSGIPAGRAIGSTCKVSEPELHHGCC